MNLSLPINTLSICRLVLYNIWCLFILFPYVILLFVFFKKVYSIVESEEQVKLVHRSQYTQLYLYDKNYHLNYIDHLYENVPFRLRSHFLTFEMLFKVLWSGCILINYEWKPVLTGYVLVLLLWIAMLQSRLFFKYDNGKLLIFVLLDAVFVFCLTCFWFSWFGWATFYLCCSLVILMIISLIVEAIINKIELKVDKKVFVDTVDEPVDVMEEKPKKASRQLSTPDESIGDNNDILVM